MMLVDQRLLVIQNDALQVSSVNEFTDSLVRELAAANEGTPQKALMRELLAGSLRRALEIGGVEAKRRFLEALAVNIQKFPLQEQQSLARVYPVEISSEYRNLQSFVEDVALDDDIPSASRLSGHPSESSSLRASSAGVGERSQGASLGVPAALPALADGVPPLPESLTELRRILAAMPSKPGPQTEDLVTRLRDDEVARELRSLDPKNKSGFFKELRLALCKFTEQAQRDLVERFPELRLELARLAESMTQEISRWLDEEQIAAQQGGDLGPVLTKVKALFQAILSAPFLATFKLLGSNEKRGKEAFLLKMALCLRTVAEKRLSELNGQASLSDLAAQLRRHFFYVEGYGVLMEDWLQNRLQEFNEEFVQGATAVIASKLQAVQTRLRRTFRPGKWLRLDDTQIQEDIYALFLDETFPRHVLTPASIAKVLRKVASSGGGDFHVYADSIARLPSTLGRTPPPSADPMEVALWELLQRFPNFPSFRPLRPGGFLFGRLEVEFSLHDGQLVARSAGVPGLPPGAPGTREQPADEFFTQRGQEEFPAAAELAVQASAGHQLIPAPKLSPGASQRPPMAALPAPEGAVAKGLPSLPPPQLALRGVPGGAAFGVPAAPAAFGRTQMAPGPPGRGGAPGQHRYEPYALVGGACAGGRLGVEDDEI